jgi:hypothetical protein
VEENDEEEEDDEVDDDDEQEEEATGKDVDAEDKLASKKACANRTSGRNSLTYANGDSEPTCA